MGTEAQRTLRRELRACGGPRHVHVYRDGSLVLKWDLENGKAMTGKPTRKLRALIRLLQREGIL